MKLIIATSNPGKLKEMQEYMLKDIWELQLKPETLEIEETGQNFTENACLKASQVAKILGEWAIADDSGLAVDALDGAPGLYSARYGKTDHDRITRLLSELGDNPNRLAQFICAIAIARPDGTIALQTEGICQGKILYQPMGTGGFGYDPIFYVPQLAQTFAQMPPEVKREISHRGQAFKQLLPQLEKMFN
ncbi:RdgB/HAM1 family non-canonical purine NTP pyrophosphatase [Chroococcus sp. FPU101]|uniref:RdgB/HAM1 family non-canonical purine NTP pyrophosphatase n=1 Tax=Chroococcus sp. FPU101 TaxID=1974212 RepID=UPI001A8E1FAD|nr:RdgB/HAM1 family non-canonical purine NTP pyrophosphatase [Chroococcus sp. FPU101]GFE71187.1 non-canonical purine NTP pyrophosphatase, rdgB/HAM1 family [Chroococcus sp. FPU101]